MDLVEENNQIITEKRSKFEKHLTLIEILENMEKKVENDILEEENVDDEQLKIGTATLKSQLKEANNESERLRADLAAIKEVSVLAQSETAIVTSQTIDLQDSIDRLVNGKEIFEFENDNLKESVVPG